MIPSMYPLEQNLGMRFYASDSKGIGGVLRRSAEDFLVDEIPSHNIEGDGDYLICKLTKKNWELQRAVKEIAKKLGMSHRRITWGGTKDKHAITTQLISIYKAEPSDVSNVNLKDISIDVLGDSRTQLSLGELEGNQFEIIIRDCDTENIEERLKEISGVVAEGVPNYYGIQRFGVIRPVTHLVGKEILKGNYEEAVACYVGYACEGEPEDTFAARTAYYETRDVREALRNMPVQLQYERALLHHLVSEPDDYKGALRSLPPKLLSMFVSAYQSYLFNLTLSNRMEQGIPLSRPETGDRLIFDNGREDIVTANNKRTAEVHMRRGKCALSIFMPGAKPLSVHGSVDEYILGLMEQDGITPEKFMEASAFTGTRFNGAHRRISLKTDVSYEVLDAEVKLKFTLPPGHYATTVCREFMKAEPVKMI